MSNCVLTFDKKQLVRGVHEGRGKTPVQIQIYVSVASSHSGVTSSCGLQTDHGERIVKQPLEVGGSRSPTTRPRPQVPIPQKSHGGAARRRHLRSPSIVRTPPTLRDHRLVRTGRAEVQSRIAPGVHRSDVTCTMEELEIHRFHLSRRAKSRLE